jgi:hypothetical protein
MFELENRWLRCMNYQPEPMTLLVTLFDNQEEVKKNITTKILFIFI